MNNTSNTKSLVEFFLLSGFNATKSARIITTDTIDNCCKIYAHLQKANKITNDTANYHYDILSPSDATQLVKETNNAHPLNLATFRHKVFGEPLPV
jgi:hypothetical protein